MLKKTITYTDFNGTDRTEEVYFNISKAELIDMSADDTFVRTITKIVAANDKTKIYNLFKDVLFMAYGEISDDGRRFIKSDELSLAFSQTVMYDKIMDELTSDADAAGKFINELLPKEMREKVAAATNQNASTN